MKILYICKANVGRSQMAAAFHKKFYPKDIVNSAGIHVHEDEGESLRELDRAVYVRKVMDEEGIDVRNGKRKQLTKKMVDEADKVIVIAKSELWPDYLIRNLKVEHWDIEDAKGKDYKFHVMTRDKIKNKVIQLKEGCI